MKSFYRYVPLFLAVVLVVGVLSGCRAQAPAKSVPAITFGLHPIVDSLPFLVAQQKGYFKDEGVDVTLEFYNSGLDRDTALQAGQADGAIADTITTILLNKTMPVRIVAIAAGVTAAEGRFAIVTSPGSSIKTPADLKGATIGISPNTIIEFTTDMMLRDAGVDPAEVNKSTVLDMGLRFQMLMQGELQAANLPDPLATLAETQGATVILDDTQGRNLSQSVMEFTDKAVNEKGESIRRMLRAYDRAVKDIQADSEQFRPLLEEKLRLPKGLTQYKIGPFSQAQVPTSDEVQLVMDWMLQKGIIKEPVPYDKLVDDQFLP